MKARTIVKIFYKTMMTFLSFALCSCQFIPGTKSYIRKVGLAAAAGQLIDPASAQFRELATSEKTLCGEINGKNRMGSYAGFHRFYVKTDSKTAFLDPEFDMNDLIYAIDLCGAMMNNSSGAASACIRVSDEKSKQTMQDHFNATWSKACENTEK